MCVNFDVREKYHSALDEKLSAKKMLNPQNSRVSKINQTRFIFVFSVSANEFEKKKTVVFIENFLF